MYRKAALGITALLAAIALAGCGSGGGGTAVAKGCTPAHRGLSTISKGTLTVSTLSYPPFIKLEGSKIAGLEGDIVNEIAKTECLTVTAKVLDAGSVVPAAQSSRVDLATGNWYRTKARAEVVGLTDPVYLDKMGIVSPSGADTFDALKGKGVGTVAGYNWNDELKKIYGNDAKVYASPAAMYGDLEKGRIGAAIDGYGVGAYANEQHGNKWKVMVPQSDPAVAASQQPAQVGFPIPKSNTKLLEAVNADIAKMREDGTLADLLTKNGLDASLAEVGPPSLI